MYSRNIQNPQLGAADGRKGQRQQLREEWMADLRLREHLHGDWPSASNPSISSLTTCPTPDQSIFSEEHDHPFYVTTQNVIMLAESEVERYSILRSLVLNSTYDLGGRRNGPFDLLVTATKTNSYRSTYPLIRVLIDHLLEPAPLYPRHLTATRRIPDVGRMYYA